LENVNKFQNLFCRPVATIIFLIGSLVALLVRYTRNITYWERFL